MRVGHATKAVPPLPFTVGAPDQNTLYHFQKNHGGGNYKKYAKGFLVGARPPTADRRRGSELRFLLKMGSSFVVKILHKQTFCNLVDRKGGFLRGIVRVKLCKQLPP